MEIYDHAIDQYIERVIGISLSDHTHYHRDYAESEIKEAVKKPEEVFHKKKEMPQIHIRCGAAVVCGVRNGDGGKLEPYESTDDELVVPTVYSADTFKEDNNAEDGRLEA